MGLGSFSHSVLVSRSSPSVMVSLAAAILAVGGGLSEFFSSAKEAKVDHAMLGLCHFLVLILLGNRFLYLCLPSRFVSHSGGGSVLSFCALVLDIFDLEFVSNLVV